MGRFALNLRHDLAPRATQQAVVSYADYQGYLRAYGKAKTRLHLKLFYSTGVVTGTQQPMLHPLLKGRIPDNYGVGEKYDYSQTGYTTRTVQGPYGVRKRHAESNS